jgi:hypothetical protein
MSDRGGEFSSGDYDTKRWEEFIASEARRICGEIDRFQRGSSEWDCACSDGGRLITLEFSLRAEARPRRGSVTVPLGKRIVQAARINPDEMDPIANLVGSLVSGHNLRASRERSPNILIYWVVVKNMDPFKRNKS